MIRQLIANFGQAGLPLVLWSGVIGALAAIVLTTIRVRKGNAFGQALARSVGEMGIVVALFAILIVGLWSYHIGQVRSLNLMPFGDFLSVPAGVPWWSPVEFAIGNTLLFLPLGLFVQLRFRQLSLGKIIFGAAGLSILIEAWQWIFGTGRVTSFDDVLFNTLGATLGALLVRGATAVARSLAHRMNSEGVDK